MRRPFVPLLLAVTLAALVAALCPALVAPASAAPSAGDTIPATSTPAGVGDLGGWYEPTGLPGPGQQRFTARIDGGEVVVRDDGLDLSLPAGDLALRLVGATPATVTGTRKQPGVVNYFLGNDPSRWRTRVPTFAGVKLAQPWPGVDVTYDLTGERVKGTFTLAPGVPVNRVRWRYDGAATSLRADGALVVRKGAAEVVEAPPVSWQDTRAGRVPVTSAFRRHSDGSVGFAVGRYDPRLPLVLDPEVVWTDLLGDAFPISETSDVAVLSDGSVVAGGQVWPDPRATGNGSTPKDQSGPGGTSSRYGGGPSDGWLGQWTPAGDLRWLSYLGGASTDHVRSLAVGTGDRVAVAARTESEDFPVRGAASRRGQPQPRTAEQTQTGDAVAALVSRDGDLLMATHLGTTADEMPEAVAFTPDGAVLIAGETGTGECGCQPPMRATGGGMEAGALTTGFVARVEPDGAQTWTATTGWPRGGASWGMVDPDDVLGLAVDSHGAVYVTGTAHQAGLPTTPGVVQRANAGGRDGWVGRMRTDGSAWDWLTYLGGSGTDVAADVAVDAAGHVVVAGDTTSPDLLGPGCADGPSGDSDLFVIRLTPDAGDAITTCVGGRLRERAVELAMSDPWNGLALDGHGSAFVLGVTESPDFPGAPTDKRSRPLDFDAALVRIDPDGSVAWSRTLGGPRDENSMGGVALGPQGRIVVGGYTGSHSGFPGAEGEGDAASDATKLGSAFVTVLRPAATDPPPPTAPPSVSASPSHSASPSPVGPTATASPAATASPTVTASPPSTPSAPMTARPTPTPSDGGARPAEVSRPSSPSPAHAERANCVLPRLRVLDPAVKTGQRARVRIVGEPGTEVRLDGYSRRRGEAPAYRTVREPVTLPASGEVEHVVVPPTNTRLRAVSGCGAGPSAVVTIAARLTVRATSHGRGVWTFAGRLAPGAGNDGRPVTLLYRKDGREVRKATATVRRGAWSVRVRFVSAGPVVLLARTGGDAVNAAARTPDLRLRVA